MANILIGKKIENQSPFIVKINNKTYETYEDKTLLRFLRDDLHITSVKDGCSQGACGTCTVIVDDKRYPACTQKLSKLMDKEVLTIEGLSDKEKKSLCLCLWQGWSCPMWFLHTRYGYEWDGYYQKQSKS